MSELIRCGWDCDNVLLHYPEILFVQYAGQRGSKINYAKFHETHSWSNIKPPDGITLNDLFYGFLSKNSHLQRAVSGAYSALRNLHSDYEHHFVTARTDKTSSLTNDVLQRIYPDVHFQTLNYGHLEQKGAVAHDLSIDVFTDDSAAELQNIVQHSPHTICLQFPSFRGQKVPYIKHARILRLSACNLVDGDPTPEHQEHVWTLAWKQVCEYIGNFLADPHASRLCST